jgi:glutaminyl-peptide cyclotransferase
VQVQGTNGIDKKRIYQTTFFRNPLKRLRGPIFSVLILSIACVCRSEKSKKNPNDQESPPQPDPAISGSPSSDVTDQIVSQLQMGTDDVRQNMLEYTKEPHPLGTKRQLELTKWLESKIKETHFSAKRHSFEATVPNPDALTDAAAPLTLKKEGHNVIAFNGFPKKASCAVVLASHYDSKILNNTSYVGANDGGSSTVALLRIMRELSAHGPDIDKLKDTHEILSCEIMLIWFDGEEAILPGWTDGLFNHPAKILDNTYGSRFLASLLSKCNHEGLKSWCLPKDLGGLPLVSLIVLDMIGSPQINLIQDTNSSPWMVNHLVKTATSLNFLSVIEKTQRGIEDDHIPFVRLGVSAIDIIDFANLTYWHAPGDTAEKISYDSMAIASKIALKMALEIASHPKDFLIPAEEKIGN